MTTYWNYNSIFEFEDPNSPWYGHTFFVYDLISRYKFKNIVELGTFTGCSFFSMCQAVKDNVLDSKLTAIDTWKGDIQAGFYDESIFNEFINNKETYYSKLNIEVIKKTFLEASQAVPNESIDLLHIDGLHTYEAVKEDFETWLPKMKSTGIILMHDTHEKTNGFGVHKLWEEIKQKYKTLEFPFSHGLGVVFLDQGTWEECSNIYIHWLKFYELKFDFQLQKYNFESANKKLNEFEISHKNYAKLYIDSGNGYSEDEVIDYQINSLGINVMNFDFAKFKNKKVKSLRFDPVDNFVHINLNSIVINTQKEKIQINNFEFSNLGLKTPCEIRAKTKDPQVHINALDIDTITNVTIVVEYIEIGSITLNNNIKVLKKQALKDKALLERANLRNKSLEATVQKLMVELNLIKSKLENYEQQKLELNNHIHQLNEQNISLRNYIHDLKASISLKVGFALTYPARRLYDLTKKKKFKINPKKLFSKKRFKIKSKLPIDIIIPVYNGFEYLEPLFKSIKENTLIPYRLIVINDASPDVRINDYLESIKSNFVEFILIKNENNLGFVKSVNKGISKTKNHFVILNTDTEVPLGWLERLMYPIFKFKNIATTTPFTNAGTICSFPNFLEDNQIFENLNLDEIDSVFREVTYPKSELEIPTGVGFCMGMNKNLLNRIGGFNEEVFSKGYGEENDWCRRAVKEGYKNLLVPNLFVYHKHGGSFTSDEKQALINRNLALLNDMHPEYNQVVANYIEQNPLNSLRKILIFKILAKISVKPFKFVTSDEQYNYDEIKVQIKDGLYFLKYKSFELITNKKTFELISPSNIYYDLHYQMEPGDKFYDLVNRNILKTKILIFDHNLGGGANFYIQRRIAKLIKQDVLVYRVYFDHFKKLYVVQSISESKITSFEFKRIQEIHEYINLKKIRKIILNELVSYPNCLKHLEQILEWKIQFGFTLESLIHDYYALCPNFTLFDINQKHCNIPDLNKCKKCLPNLKFEDGLSIDTKISLKIWRKQWLELLRHSNEVICFSESSKKLLLKAHPKLSSKTIKVVPHKVDYLDKIKINNCENLFNIAVLGNIHSDAKGGKILHEISKLLAKNTNIKIHILGQIKNEYLTENMQIYGQYKQVDLPKIMQNLKINLVFIPSVWAETFSYTTNETIKLGLPLLTFDLGAQSEYAKKYTKGYIINKIDAKNAYDAILNIYNKYNVSKTNSKLNN